mmetsp:Transcript_24310/g.34818  ORF Transcript_24310/g.34818 Transcript_24310/m.34818 type:complete len:440 (+) Transcript_24310:57-1376(+)
MTDNSDRKAKEGILRSKPRYSTNNNDGANSNINSTTLSSENGSVNINNVPVRPSLADLMRSSAELSAEAARITNEDVGRVVSHQHYGVPSSNAPEIAVVNNIIQEQQEQIITEGMPLLQISESGAPYLKVGGVADASTNNSGPAVVDAHGDIAFGIVGDDGEHVRFCEHNIDDDGKENDENVSSRERIQHRLYMNDANDEDMFDQEEPEDKCNISDSDSDATDDDAILAELGMSDLIPSDHDSDYEPEEYTMPKKSNNPDERAFLIIWQTLSRWVTPATIDLLLHGQCVDDKSTAEPEFTASSEELSNDEASERKSVEIGASRRSGIMSMIRMYIARSMAELKRMPQQTQQQKDIINDSRKIEQRLADLVRTFDINGPVAKFNAKQWKVMIIILIVISFPSLVTEDSGSLPASARSLGMTTDEYRYLTQSAVTSLSNAL